MNFKKYMPILFGLIITIIGMFAGAENVSAATLSEVRIDTVWYERTSPTQPYGNARFREWSIDGRVTYCIEPGIPITMYNYYQNGGLVASPYSNQVNQLIQLIGHYGYDYPGHQTLRYRMATQKLIWEAVSDYTITYSTARAGGGTRYDLSYEINQIMNLVNNHYVRPSFNGGNYTVSIADTLTITDTNNMLRYYTVYSSPNATTTISGDQLRITPTGLGDVQIVLARLGYDNQQTFIYTGLDGLSQKMGYFRVSDPVTATIRLNITGGKVTINKLDSDTNSNTVLISSESTLQGAVYGIYDMSNTLITTATTGIDGTITSNFLPKLGDFYLKEITPSTGYQLDPTLYYFTITTANLFPTIKTYQKIINRDVELIKVYASGETGILKPETGIVFGFYNNKGIKIIEATTDLSGYLKVNLPYGKFTVKQENTSPNTEKVADFEISVYEMGESYRYTISNAEITAKLKVIKIDGETGEVITKGGIQFKIFDLTKNEYVCQTITYPTAGKLCVFATDTNGILITPYPLASGRYLLEEIDQVIDGYLWNSNKVEFEIGEESNLIADNEYGILLEISFSNNQVKGQIIIQKTGEKLVIENGTYYYEKIVLEGVRFGLYASEDIIINGYKYYSKNELIAELVTDKFGNISYDNLPLGKYYIKELESVNGNLLDKTIYTFELKYKDQYTETIYYTLTLQNRLPKAKLEFTKTDLVNDKGLPNTKIEIYDEFDNLIFSGITDEFGKIIITDLFIGKFYIIESEAPEGYILNPEKMWFEITADGEVVKANLTNEMIVNVPNTGINTINIAYIGGSLLILIGLWVFLYDKKKK